MIHVLFRNEHPLNLSDSFLKVYVFEVAVMQNTVKTKKQRLHSANNPTFLQELTEAGDMREGGGGGVFI